MPTRIILSHSIPCIDSSFWSMKIRRVCAVWLHLFVCLCICLSVSVLQKRVIHSCHLISPDTKKNRCWKKKSTNQHHTLIYPYILTYLLPPNNNFPIMIQTFLHVQVNVVRSLAVVSRSRVRGDHVPTSTVQTTTVTAQKVNIPLLSHSFLYTTILILLFLLLLLSCYFACSFLYIIVLILSFLLPQLSCYFACSFLYMLSFSSSSFCSFCFLAILHVLLYMLSFSSFSFCSLCFLPPVQSFLLICNFL